MKVSMVQPLSILMFSYLTNTTSAIRIPCRYSGLIITYINDKNNGEDIWILKVDNKFFLCEGDERKETHFKMRYNNANNIM